MSLGLSEKKHPFTLLVWRHPPTHPPCQYSLPHLDGTCGDHLTTLNTIRSDRNRRCIQLRIVYPVAIVCTLVTIVVVMWWC